MGVLLVLPCRRKYLHSRYREEDGLSRIEDNRSNKSLLLLSLFVNGKNLFHLHAHRTCRAGNEPRSGFWTVRVEVWHLFLNYRRYLRLGQHPDFFFARLARTLLKAECLHNEP